MKKFKHLPSGDIYEEGTNAYSETFFFRGARIPLSVVTSGKDWEEIKEIKENNEYIIISFKDSCTIYNLKKDGRYANNDSLDGSTVDQMLSYSFVKINSIKRISDEQIFSIGDNVVFNKIHKFIIEKFYFDCNNNHLLCSNNAGTGHVNISKIEKIKEPIFTTEDGVDIYEGNKYWVMRTDKFPIVSFHWKVDGKPNKGRDNIKYAQIANTKNGVYWFSTKEKAEEFIIFNKPCLSINDVLKLKKIIFNHWDDELKQMVKSKL